MGRALISADRAPLAAWGWSEEWEQAYLTHPLAGASVPGRVVCQEKTWLQVQTAFAREPAKASGHLRHVTSRQTDLPLIGDWVLVPASARAGERWGIEAVLARGPVLVRSEGEKTQVMASNVDDGLVLAGLDQMPTLSWIDRAVALLAAGGLRPAILLNKADTHPDTAAYVESVRAHFPALAVHVVSARTGLGLADVEPLTRAGRTVVMLGPSGAGKSSVLNALLGEATAATGAVRASDAKGRHTTTHRELFVLPSGALLVDIPGVRELGLTSNAGASEDAFADVLAIAARCQFRDCRHRTEPDCAVLRAREDGTLAGDRVDAFCTLEAIRRGERPAQPAHWRRTTGPRR